jgi:pimeloyl-ACP methyl ester carboxylesterase
VLGFYSTIDGSPQPYGVEIPEGLAYGRGQAPVPMWIWLHGRGDTSTDLSFVHGKLMAKKPGQFQPAGTIVIHPFGRYCNGWKSAGETDAFEARDDAMARFNADPDRIALAGFSMGGAGAWHIGAHFADQWACVHTGAGFVDVKRYQKVTAENMPPWYEQKLWGTYDVPDVARNFFNVPLISYSGENDKQRDSAEYMVEVLAAEDYTLKHLIGPGVEHKYQPDVLKEVQALIEAEVQKGRDPMPDNVVLQFRSARYNRMFWMECLEVENGWEDTRIEAGINPAGAMRVNTRNDAAFRVEAAIFSKFEPRP